MLEGTLEARKVTQQTRQSQLIANFGPGDILGFDQIDYGSTCDLMTWVECISAVEVAWIERD